MRTLSASSRLPIVAVVGRPNVGKSSLVNRLLGRREAIVEETPGVTRDRASFTAHWAGRAFEVVDTGGLEIGTRGLEERVAEQARVAIDAADVILLVVDAVVGPTEDDLAVADTLRRSGKPVLVAANKVDDAATEPGAADFYRLGLGDPWPVSALHGRGSGDLLDALVVALPEELPEPPGKAWASVAIVGRPNVGKSSILNSLVGHARAIVHEDPGTTRDPVDSYLALAEDRVVRIVDTAGIRRQVQMKDPLEYFAWLRSQRTLTRVDVALLVVDAAEGVTSADQRIARAVLEAGRACVIALNKWDLVGEADDPDVEKVWSSVREGLRFVHWATFVPTSARTGRGMPRLVDALVDAVQWHRVRLPTAWLNRVLREAQAEVAHPRAGGREARVLYAVQTGSSPPRIALFANAPLQKSYLRYLENQIRAAEPFTGSPLVLAVRLRSAR